VLQGSEFRVTVEAYLHRLRLLAFLVLRWFGILRRKLVTGGGSHYFVFLFAPTLEHRADFSLSFIIFTDGRAPWTGDQLVARPLPKHRTT
jgi:hypothetical protein